MYMGKVSLRYLTSLFSFFSGSRSLTQIFYQAKILLSFHLPVSISYA